MPSIKEVGIGQRLSFDVYPSAVIGRRFQDVILEAHLSAAMAQLYGEDIATMHAQVYNSLPPGTVPDDPFGYSYIQVRHPTGQYSIIGAPWVRPETIELSSGNRVTMVFEDKTEADINRMINALSANGYNPNSVATD